MEKSELGNHLNNREETIAVKRALAKAGIRAKITHSSGGTWGWLHINLGDPGSRNGLQPHPSGYGMQYTKEEMELHAKVLKIAQEVTGREGEYDGEIIILAQGEI